MPEAQFKNELTDEIKVSPAAAEQMLTIMNSEEGINGIRIFVSGGGCSGMTYGMTFVDRPSDFDAVLKKDDVNIYIDAVALGFLEGVEIDYQTEGLNQSFVFKNVFASTGGGNSCGGCGSAGH
ncbi:MAG TPA: iron-sulfur cluster assembly accessory protein [Gammaproteobacteria bacterium]|nr:iron-sulfur cluster assembly accessory protein [Gammaproteobacteria bacterium]